MATLLSLPAPILERILAFAIDACSESNIPRRMVEIYINKFTGFALVAKDWVSPICDIARSCALRQLIVTLETVDQDELAEVKRKMQVRSNSLRDLMLSMRGAAFAFGAGYFAPAEQHQFAGTNSFAIRLV